MWYLMKRNDQVISIWASRFLLGVGVRERRAVDVKMVLLVTSVSG